AVPTQFASALQVTRHAVPPALQLNRPQLTVPPSTHVPEPLQRSWFDWTPALHACAAHCVPEAHFSHAPPPSHEPSWPHVDCAEELHSLSGSDPALMAPQVPSAPLVFFAA